MPNCIACGQETFKEYTNLCSLCAYTLPPGSRLWSEVKVVDASPMLVPGRVGTRVALTMLLEDAKKIEKGGNTTLKDNMADWVGHMCTYLDSRGYWNATAATSVGDQNTPNNCKSGKVSLDFQGIREGTQGTFWIDLQGQEGGGGSKRNSYCQVLIQTCVGGPVPVETITAALLQSLTGGAKRAIIYKDGGSGRPK